jgi:hypothetical protein
MRAGVETIRIMWKKTGLIANAVHNWIICVQPHA